MIDAAGRASADPRAAARARSRATTRELKESKQALGAEVLTAVAEWTPSTLLSLGARIATPALPFNLVVTNVPGPQVPLYLLGARMLEPLPAVPLLQTPGLGVALFSYAGKLFWGFNADAERMPDLGDLRADLERAFEELAAVAAL